MRTQPLVFCLIIFRRLHWETFSGLSLLCYGQRRARPWGNARLGWVAVWIPALQLLQSQSPSSQADSKAVIIVIAHRALPQLQCLLVRIVTRPTRDRDHPVGLF
jgi:hypothetical protein